MAINCHIQVHQFGSIFHVIKTFIQITKNLQDQLEIHGLIMYNHFNDILD